MVVGGQDMQADIVFVIEGTAINGAYLNDLKSNYIIPTLEYFSHSLLDENNYVTESTNVQYGIVVYQAADCLPNPSSESYGPYTSHNKVLNILDKIELVGGKGESHANIAEGLATALQCFEDLQQRRDANIVYQKHCILLCNSPPYLLPVMESPAYLNHTAEQLAGLLQERGIHLSILSPRKIPALFKLYEKAGGDLQTSQTKNYAKDPRHLVLLKGFSLKERPISPPLQPHGMNIPIPSLPSPLPNMDSPLGPVVGGSVPQTAPLGSQAQQQSNFRPIGNPNMLLPTQQQQQQQMAGTLGRGAAGFPQQHPPGYPGAPGGIIPRAPPRWNMMPPQQTRPFTPSAGQSSPLIAQLSQPPTAFQHANQVLVGQQTQQQQQQQQQQQLVQQQQQQQMTQQQQNIRLPGILGAQQQSLGGPTQVQSGAPGQSPGVPGGVPNTATSFSGGVSGGVPGQVPGGVPTGVPGGVGQGVPGAPPPGQPMPGGQGAPQAQNQMMGVNGPQGGQVPVGTVVRDRHVIWNGILEWIEKNKSPNDTQKLTRHVPCQVSASPKDGEPELKADAWPQN